jgi:PadR family transcriptional regulator PadR
MIALAEAPTAWRYGYDLCRQLGLKAGSVYPILIRLSDRGLLDSTWESDPPAGRPPRHLYRLSATGVATARDLSRSDTPRLRPQLRPEGA